MKKEVKVVITETYAFVTSVLIDAEDDEISALDEAEDMFYSNEFTDCNRDFLEATFELASDYGIK